MSRWYFTFALGALAACGPVESSAILIDAQAELAAAQTAQADKLAPFEFVAAEAYLHKAREEQSYADFQAAVTFARKSRDCARVARARAESSTRTELGAPGTAPTTTARCRPGPNAVPLDEAKVPAKKKSEPKDPPSVRKEDLPEGDAEATAQ